MSGFLQRIVRHGVLAGVLFFAGDTFAQALRFSTHREVDIPEYATVRIGPFYSTMLYSQSVAYRWTRSEGRGTDYLRDNERGVIRKDGSEMPIVSRLRFRNYLLITRNTDVDLSMDMRYEYYPLDSQEDEFSIDMVEEGIFGNLSVGLRLTPYLRGSLYDRLTIRTDYVDTRGLEDRYGGSRYEYLDNRVGVDLDWLLAKDKNLGVGVSRTDVFSLNDEFENQDRVSYYETLLYEQALLEGFVLGARVGYRQTDYKEVDRQDTRQQDYDLFARARVGRRAEPGQGVAVRVSDATELRLHIGASVAYVGDAGVRVRDEETDEDEITAEASGSDVTLTGGAALRTNIRKDLWHQVSYERGLRSGFDSAFDEFQDFGYELHWAGVVSLFDVNSVYSLVTPSRETRSEYTNWRTHASLSYPLFRGIDFVYLVLDSTYTMRENRSVKPDVDLGDEPEAINDYTTWVSRIGTRFHVTKGITFQTYYQRAERSSDSNDLAYTRDTFEARATYNHQF